MTATDTQYPTTDDGRPMRVGLFGYGRAGKAVARVLHTTPGMELCWIARRSDAPAEVDVPTFRFDRKSFSTWLDRHPVDAVVDFSNARSIWLYGEILRERGITLVTGISNYPRKTRDYIATLGSDMRVLASPNITLGINFLIFAAKALRSIAPFADVEIVEQHFREKPDVSGTAKKLAEVVSLDPDKVTSLRLGGIVGHHEVIFGFPHQTVRLIHDSIRREAFGTGAVFALRELVKKPLGGYSFDDLLLDIVRREFLAAKGHAEILPR